MSKTVKELALETVTLCRHRQGACTECIERSLVEHEKAVREDCARLHESIDPACDHEKQAGSPGAGAMGAIVAYRDLIRSAK